MTIPLLSVLSLPIRSIVLRNLNEFHDEIGEIRFGAVFSHCLQG